MHLLSKPAGHHYCFKEELSEASFSPIKEKDFMSFTIMITSKKIVTPAVPIFFHFL